ncbi:hypothetical protein ABFS83_10G115700 [Erythranthe nasuta]
MEDYTDDESGSMTVRRTEKGHYDFVVRNYSLQKGIGVGEPIESEEFVVGGHRWTVCFDPNGKNVDACNSGNASLFIWLAGDSATNVDCLYDMHILDQSGKGNHSGVSLIEGAPQWFRFTSLKGGHLTGCLRFMKRASFESRFL